MTTLMVLDVTPGQVAPPLSPPAHCATHGGCSLRPVMQNGLPVVVPLAGAATPRCFAAVAPLLPTGAVPVDVLVGALPVAPLLDEPVAPGTVAPVDGSAPGDDCALGEPPLNCPPSGPFAVVAPFD